MMPPFKTPSNASYFFSGFHSATTSLPACDSSPFFRKLRICKPSEFAAPQPKHMFSGAYFSCSDCWGFINSSSSSQSLSALCAREKRAEEEAAEDYLGD